MLKVKWMLSYGFCCKFHTLSSSTNTLKKSVKIWQSYREFKGGNFFQTVYSSLVSESNATRRSHRLACVWWEKRWRRRWCRCTAQTWTTGCSCRYVKTCCRRTTISARLDPASHRYTATWQLTLSVPHFSDCSKMSLPNRSGPYWSNSPFF